MSEGLTKDFIQNALDKDYNKANDVFGEIMNIKVADILDQEKIKSDKKVVAELINKGIKDLSVLDAISKVPRHMFMDSGFIDHAYQDKAFPISSGQTISQPYTVAFQSQLLQIEKGDKILEIGTGSGYQTSILAKMGRRVYSLERFQKLPNYEPNLT